LAVFRPGRHLAPELLDQRLRHGEQRTGLLPEESRGVDKRFEFGNVGPGHRTRVGEAGEQRRRELVDAHVGRLRGQDGGHQQLDRRAGGGA